MKLISLSILLLLLGACSSGSKNDSGISYDADLEKEFKHLEDSDFVAPDPVPYVSSQDKYPDDIAEEDALGKESMARLPEPDLEDVDDDDPLAFGVSLCYQGKISAGVMRLDKSFSTYRTHPGFWTSLGTCHLLGGNSRKALLFYNKARDLKKNYVPAINNLGVIYQRRGEDQKALSAYKKAAKLAKNSRTPKYNLAQLYLRFGFVDEAIGILKAINVSHVEDPEVLAALGTANLIKGNVQTASDYFNKIDSDYFKRADISLNFAVSLKLMGDLGGARNILKEIDLGKLGSMAEYYHKVVKFVGVQ